MDNEYAIGIDIWLLIWISLCKLFPKIIYDWGWWTWAVILIAFIYLCRAGIKLDKKRKKDEEKREEAIEKRVEREIETTEKLRKKYG